MDHAASNGNEKQSKISKWTLAALAGVPLIMVLGNSMLIPVLPTMQNSLKISQIQASMVITLFSVPAGITIPLAGFLSDRFGRKAVIIPALIIYGVGGIIAGLAPIFLKSHLFAWVLGGRILQGIGASGTAPIAMAFCGDLWKGKERSKSLGIIEASNGLGKVVSPILGSLIGLITWYAVLLAFPIIIIPIVLGVWLICKEAANDKKPPKFGEYFATIKQIFKKKSPLLLSSFFAGAIALMILFGVMFFLSDYLEKTFGLNGVIKGAALAIPVLFMSTTSYFTGALIKKKVNLMKWLVVSGLGLITLALGILPLFKNVYLFFVCISIAGIGTGLVLPCLNTLITGATSTEERGLVTSLYGSVRFFGVAAGPPLFGYLMKFSRSAMFWTAAGIALVGAISALIFIKVKAITKQSPQEDTPKQAPESKSHHLTPRHLVTGFAAKKPLTRNQLREEEPVNNGEAEDK